ncbi:unnamed protein product [Schistosoma mattheei]|uniref:Uncharacterized protein n=1 Tax=Schistosoma mattheei TaxID=31246 RepID=A0A183Q450_9TREM|nr:unnamed protein product [Schistosoma mattheei]
MKVDNQDNSVPLNTLRRLGKDSTAICPSSSVATAFHSSLAFSPDPEVKF